MRHRLAFAATLACAAPAAALDIAGNVLDKQAAPVAGAQVCIKSEPGTCVATGAQGQFRLTKAIAVRPRAGEAGFRLAYRGGALQVQSPEAGPARLEWLSPDGRRTWATSDLRLVAGRNAVALPPGLPPRGLLLLRLTTADRTLAWKAVLADGRDAGDASGSAPRIAALSKAAAAATLEISKSGFRTRTYEPLSETETGAVILLSATGDAGLTFGGTVHFKILALDRAKRSLVTESNGSYCDPETDTLVLQAIRDTQSYVIRDGKLWTWDVRDCTGQLFTGTSTDIVGKWNLVDDAALLPEDLRAGCVPDSSLGEESAYENYSGGYTVTETEVTGSVSAETCPGDYYGFLFGQWIGTTADLTRNTCLQLVFKKGDGTTGTFDFTKHGTDSLHLAFAYQAKTCAGNQDFSLSDKDPTCPEGAELDPFFSCMAGSGFADVPPLIKAAAPAPMSFARAAPRPASPWLPAWRDRARRETYISRIWKAAHPGR